MPDNSLYHYAFLCLGSEYETVGDGQFIPYHAPGLLVRFNELYKRDGWVREQGAFLRIPVSVTDSTANSAVLIGDAVPRGWTVELARATYRVLHPDRVVGLTDPPGGLDYLALEAEEADALLYRFGIVSRALSSYPPDFVTAAEITKQCPSCSPGERLFWDTWGNPRLPTPRSVVTYLPIPQGGSYFEIEAADPEDSSVLAEILHESEHEPELFYRNFPQREIIGELASGGEAYLYKEPVIVLPKRESESHVLLPVGDDPEYISETLPEGHGGGGICIEVQWIGQDEGCFEGFSECSSSCYRGAIAFRGAKSTDHLVLVTQRREDIRVGSEGVKHGSCLDGSIFQKDEPGEYTDILHDDLRSLYEVVLRGAGNTPVVLRDYREDPGQPVCWRDPDNKEKPGKGQEWTFLKGSRWDVSVGRAYLKGTAPKFALIGLELNTDEQLKSFFFAGSAYWHSVLSDPEDSSQAFVFAVVDDTHPLIAGDNKNGAKKYTLSHPEGTPLTISDPEE